MTKARDLAGFASSSVTTTASDGLVLKGDGSSTDVVIKNGANATVATVADGTTNLAVVGAVTGALARGAIQVGNSSGVAAALAKGTSGYLLTAGANDLSWAAPAPSGAAFAGTTLTVSGNATLTNAQQGFLLFITSTNSKVLFLPAASEGMFYVVNNDTSVVHYFSANGTNTINGSVAAFVIPANSSGIIACNASNNWSTIGMTRSGLVAQVTTVYGNNPGGGNLTGTYTTSALGSGLFIAVTGSHGGSWRGPSSGDSYRGGGAGGPCYAEKFIASPAASYAYTLGQGGEVHTNAGGNTVVDGMTLTSGPSSPSSSYSSANYAGRAAGTVSGSAGYSSIGGSGASGSLSTTGGGGGAATRAGNGGNGSTYSNANGAGGGTGGNNASSSAYGAAATAKASGSYVVSGVTSETYRAATTGNGAGAETILNYGSDTVTLFAGRTIAQTNGGTQGGGYSNGLAGGITFVEFI